MPFFPVPLFMNPPRLRLHDVKTRFRYFCPDLRLFTKIDSKPLKYSISSVRRG